MKIIFLDIDGVLVTSRYLKLNGCNRNEFDPVTVRNLNEIISLTKAKIVISSNWRRGKTLDELKKIFEENGIVGEIVGMTPYRNDTFTIMRGDEIDDYLTEKGRGIEGFVIIDDEEKMLHLDEYYVQTDFRYGITDEIKKTVIHRLD